MRIFLLTLLTMAAFAANSVLTRYGVTQGGLSPMQFATLRVVTGAIALAILVVSRSGHWRSILAFHPKGAISLTLYLLGFSLAYQSLDAGIGALILFGFVQLTIFASVVFTGDKIGGQRLLGAIIAFAGLVYLCFPSDQFDINLVGVFTMAAAGIGWGAYTILGRTAEDPLLRTGQNFFWAALIVASVALLQFEARASATLFGVISAILSGVVMSAMGYALWYAILPKLQATVAGVAQLSVPVIATIGGFIFLGEAVQIQTIIASVIVLTGIAVSLSQSR